jgi:hypothetical protein
LLLVGMDVVGMAHGCWCSFSQIKIVADDQPGNRIKPDLGRIGVRAKECFETTLPSPECDLVNLTKNQGRPRREEKRRGRGGEGGAPKVLWSFAHPDSQWLNTAKLCRVWVG